MIGREKRGRKSLHNDCRNSLDCGKEWLKEKQKEKNQLRIIAERKIVNNCGKNYWKRKQREKIIKEWLRNKENYSDCRKEWLKEKRKEKISYKLLRNEKLLQLWKKWSEEKTENDCGMKEFVEKNGWKTNRRKNHLRIIAEWKIVTIMENNDWKREQTKQISKRMIVDRCLSNNEY